MKTKSFHTGTALVLAILVLALAGAVVPAQAITPTTVHDFNGTPGPVNPNIEAIAQGRDGNLYLTSFGGSGGAVNCSVTYCGEAFNITPSGTVTDVFDFSNNSCPADFCGYYAYGGLTLGADGNFYGATYRGGTTGDNGTVFQLTPAGVATALHNFAGTSDGSHPYGAPIQGTNGIFYGTTTSASVPDSTAYSVTSSGVFTTQHTFTGTDGQTVYAPLVQGTDGNFYGDTAAGGTSGNGVIFKMTPLGTVTVLHNFTGTDGSNSTFPLIQASDGNFYGSTYAGGTAGAGVIFKITPSGTYTVLHNINGTTDGNGPWGSLVQATDGKLYGVTNNASVGNLGTIYSVTTSGTFTTLYSFTGSTDGSTPMSPLRQHTNGLLYGTTFAGGDVNNCSSNVGGSIVLGCGEVYSLDIGAAPFVSLVTTSGRVGDQIGILGQGFTSASVVKFAGTQATTITLSGTTFIAATVPVGAVTGNVTVTTGSTTLTSNNIFRVAQFVSRKIHGGTGAFDITLPLTGNSGIECRSGGANNDYQMVFTFPGSVTFTSAAFTAGTGTVSGTSGNATNTVTVNLTGVTNAQRITVTLMGVNDGNTTADVPVSMGVLVGDTTANGAVDSSDIAQTQSQSGQPVTADNFREDVTVNGAINSSDIALVQSRSGTALPPPPAPTDTNSNNSGVKSQPPKAKPATSHSTWTQTR
jgi:uncharacterized repeat protein (TIGR03803 family)